MAYSTGKHGRADYGQWMELNPAALSGMIEGDGSLPLSAQRFASFVYVVNPSVTTISGSVSVDSVGIDGSSTVKVSGDQLKVFYQGAINALNNLNREVAYVTGQLNALISTSKNYSRIIRVDEVNNFLYEMKADIGTLSTDSYWQIKRVHNLSGNLEIEWANGSDSFTNSASGYQILPYTT